MLGESKASYRMIHCETYTHQPLELKYSRACEQLPVRLDRRPDEDDFLNYKRYLVRWAGLSTSSREFPPEWAAGTCAEENNKGSEEQTAYLASANSRTLQSTKFNVSIFQEPLQRFPHILDNSGISPR